jgi:hypothetical protein
MNILFEEHITIIASLIKHKVEFMLVGGYAVIHYGYRRTTGDMDLWIKPDNQNKQNLIEVLKEMNFDLEELKELASLDFTTHILFSIGDEPFKVDFMTYVNMVKWEEANNEKIYAEIENLKIPIIHLNHLILSKINNDRLKDKSDVEELQKIQNKHL